MHSNSVGFSAKEKWSKPIIYIASDVFIHCHAVYDTASFRSTWADLAQSYSPVALLGVQHCTKRLRCLEVFCAANRVCSHFPFRTFSVNNEMQVSVRKIPPFSVCAPFETRNESHASNGSDSQSVKKLIISSQCIVASLFQSITS